MVVGDDDGSSPASMRAFVNRDDLDFETAAVLPPTQEWELAPNPQAQLEYQTRFTKFQGVSSLTLHLPTCFNGDSTRMYAHPHARGEGAGGGGGSE